MRLTKIKNPKNDKSENQIKKSLTTFQEKNNRPESIILNNILQKNSSFKNLKEKIKKESNTNIKEIFATDENRLKAIKYVLKINKEKHENKSNLINKSYELPLSYSQNYKLNENEKPKNKHNKKINEITPIKSVENKNKFHDNDEPQFLIDSPLNIEKNKNNSNIISQRDANLKNIKKIKNEKNSKNKLFYHKINYKKNNNKSRDRAIDSKEEILRNKTLNNFYVHKKINKSGINEYINKTSNKINKYKNNNQGINVFYSTKNINYDIMYNFPENYNYNNHRKNESYDEYYKYSNFPKKSNNFKKKIQNDLQNSLYISEVDNESDTCNVEGNFNRIKYINNANKIRFGEKKKRNIIRLMNNYNISEDFYDENDYDEENKKDKNTLNIKDIKNGAPISLNKSKDIIDNRYNMQDNLFHLKNQTCSEDFFTHNKKNYTNFNIQGNLYENNNNEKKHNNLLIFKKKSIKDNTILNSVKKLNSFKKNYILNITSNNYFSILPKLQKVLKSDSDNDDGFILSKKLGGKTIFEIKIEDDINKFNKIIKEKNIKIENKPIEIISINDKDNIDIMKKRIKNLENELKKIEEEHEALIRKDYLKNELINKLDKEKQNLIEENKKILIDLEQKNKLNKEFDKQLIQLKSENKKIINNCKEEKVISFNINSNRNDSKDSINSKNEMNKTPSSEGQSNNLSMNINNSNLEVGLESKKSNPISIFRLSKISEIKKMDNNIDSGEREIKNNIELLNIKLSNKEKINQGINPFNNKDN